MHSAKLAVETLIAQVANGLFDAMPFVASLCRRRLLARVWPRPPRSQALSPPRWVRGRELRMASSHGTTDGCWVICPVLPPVRCPKACFGWHAMLTSTTCFPPPSEPSRTLPAPVCMGAGAGAHTHGSPVQGGTPDSDTPALALCPAGSGALWSVYAVVGARTLGPPQRSHDWRVAVHGTILPTARCCTCRVAIHLTMRHGWLIPRPAAAGQAWRQHLAGLHT